MEIKQANLGDLFLKSKASLKYLKIKTLKITSCVVGDYSLPVHAMSIFAVCTHVYYTGLPNTYV